MNNNEDFNWEKDTSVKEEVAGKEYLKQHQNKMKEYTMLTHMFKILTLKSTNKKVNMDKDLKGIFDFFKQYEYYKKQVLKDDKNHISGTLIQDIESRFNNTMKIYEKQQRILVLVYSMNDIKFEGGNPYIEINEEKYRDISMKMGLNTELLKIENETFKQEEYVKEKDNFIKMKENNTYGEIGLTERAVDTKIENLENKILISQENSEEFRKIHNKNYGPQSSGILRLILENKQSEVNNYLNDSDNNKLITNYIESITEVIYKENGEIRDVVVNSNMNDSNVVLGKNLPILVEMEKSAIKEEDPQMKGFAPTGPSLTS